MEVIIVYIISGKGDVIISIIPIIKITIRSIGNRYIHFGGESLSLMFYYD